MFIDKIKIKIKSGDGGDGCLSFHKEKYVAKGGPDGGDGGNGGNIYFEVDNALNNLSTLNYNNKYYAQNGGKGSPNFCHGKNGEDLIIKVPKGTLIIDEESGGIIADTAQVQKILVLKGGKGGKGNAKYKNSVRQAPRFCQTGQKTKERVIILELKLIADIGLIGCPNAGKSTLLSVISNAKPKIASYAFTTLSPNIGILSKYGKNFVVADIPGLIEGAGHGSGLGFQFLRHIERTSILVHLIDVSQVETNYEEVLNNFNIIIKELKTYSDELSKKKQVIVFNKCEIIKNKDILSKLKKDIKKSFKQRTKILEISAQCRIGINEFTDYIIKVVETIPKSSYEYVPYTIEEENNEFEIQNDNGVFIVSGGLIDQLARNVVLEDFESSTWFSKKMKEYGIDKALRNIGAKNGDIVKILDTEFEFME